MINGELLTSRMNQSRAEIVLVPQIKARPASALRPIPSIKTTQEIQTVSPFPKFDLSLPYSPLLSPISKPIKLSVVTISSMIPKDDALESKIKLTSRISIQELTERLLANQTPCEKRRKSMPEILSPRKTVLLQNKIKKTVAAQKKRQNSHFYHLLTDLRIPQLKLQRCQSAICFNNKLPKKVGYFKNKNKNTNKSPKKINKIVKKKPMSNLLKSNLYKIDQFDEIPLKTRKIC